MSKTTKADPDLMLDRAPEPQLRTGLPASYFGQAAETEPEVETDLVEEQVPELTEDEQQAQVDAALAAEKEQQDLDSAAAKAEADKNQQA